MFLIRTNVGEKGFRNERTFARTANSDSGDQEPSCALFPVEMCLFLGVSPQCVFSRVRKNMGKCRESPPVYCWILMPLYNIAAPWSARIISENQLKTLKRLGLAHI